MRPLLFSLALYAGLLACPGQLFAHPGGLDDNGCHYERSKGGDWQESYHCHQEAQPNPNLVAPARKSRENICHDAGSPNYKSMRQCTSSGGRPYKR